MIGHGFDDSGGQYDEKGNLHNWWNREDLQKFAELKAKVVAQANSYEVLPGLFAKGELEAGEILADQSGAEIAMRAYLNQDAQKKLPRKKALQRFFKQVAITWRSNQRGAAARMFAESDFHPSAEYRVNGTLKNMGILHHFEECSHNP